MGIENDRRKDIPREGPTASSMNDGSGKGGSGGSNDFKDLTGPKIDRAAERSKIEKGPATDFKDLTGPKIDRKTPGVQ